MARRQLQIETVVEEVKKIEPEQSTSAQIDNLHAIN